MQPLTLRFLMTENESPLPLGATETPKFMWSTRMARTLVVLPIIPHLTNTPYLRPTARRSPFNRTAKMNALKFISKILMSTLRQKELQIRTATRDFLQKAGQPTALAFFFTPINKAIIGFFGLT